MLKYAGIYATTNAINAAVPFLLLPLLTNYLTPAEYGIVAMFQVLMNGVLPFIGFNLESAVGRQYFDRDSSDFSNYVTNSLYILFTSTIITGILFLATGKFIEKYSEFPEEWLWAVLVFAIAQKIAEVLLSIWRVKNKAIEFGLFRIFRTGMDMGLSIFFIVVLKRSWEGRIEGQVVAMIFFALISLAFLYREGYIKQGLKWAYIKSVLWYGVPLVPHVLGAIVITYSDRFFITNMIGLEEMGLYSVGYQIGMIIGLLQNSFNQAWQPWIFEKIKKDKIEEKRRIVIFTYFYFVVLILLASFVALIGPFIVDLMTNNSYAGATPFISWIAFGFAFNGMYKMFSHYLFYQRKTELISLLTGVIAILNIGLNYFLIKINGALGAAQSTAISFFVQFILVWIISSRVYSMPWFDLKKLTLKQ